MRLGGRVVTTPGGKRRIVRLTQRRTLKVRKGTRRTLLLSCWPAGAGDRGGEEELPRLARPGVRPLRRPPQGARRGQGQDGALRRRGQVAAARPAALPAGRAARRRRRRLPGRRGRPDDQPRPPTARSAASPCTWAATGSAAGPILTGRTADGILGPASACAPSPCRTAGGRRRWPTSRPRAGSRPPRTAPYGLVDMRKRGPGGHAAARCGRGRDRDPVRPLALRPRHHGRVGRRARGLPQVIADRTVEAIVEALPHACGRARSTTAPRPAATCCPTSSTTTQPNKVVDSDVRVLQARDRRRAARSPRCSTSRPTPPCSARQPQGRPATGCPAAAPPLAERFGGEALTMVGTLGPHPTRRPRLPPPRRCRRRARRAICARSAPTPSAWSSAPRMRPSAAKPAGRQPAGRRPLVPGPGRGHQRADPGAELRRASPPGAELNRSITPPWLTGNVLGTITASAAHRRRAAVDDARARPTRRSR